ncbi:MAG: P5-type ATPase cation transporter-domain-containing protein [Olpidium bornovanus]|uniref:Cation-transporting ATPase n=1 Tax=Olpidium bornovanus TaxID=278681 RepID=A0A8H8DGZ1_9FUNG|nr:MAG: P5-type ATPase cation transporter-domain-containing protein [Olpidium bornovanus]
MAPPENRNHPPPPHAAFPARATRGPRFPLPETTPPRAESTQNAAARRPLSEAHERPTDPLRSGNYAQRPPSQPTPPLFWKPTRAGGRLDSRPSSAPPSRGLFQKRKREWWILALTSNATPSAHGTTAPPHRRLPPQQTGRLRGAPTDSRRATGRGLALRLCRRPTSPSPSETAVAAACRFVSGNLLGYDGRGFPGDRATDFAAHPHACFAPFVVVFSLSASLDHPARIRHEPRTGSYQVQDVPDVQSPPRRRSSGFSRSAMPISASLLQGELESDVEGEEGEVVQDDLLHHRVPLLNGGVAEHSSLLTFPHNNNKASHDTTCHQELLLEEEDLHLSIVGYHFHRYRVRVYYFLCVATGGILYLLGRWIPRLWVAWVGKACPLGQAQWVVAENSWGEVSTERVKRKYYGGSLGSVFGCADTEEAPAQTLQSPSKVCVASAADCLCDG